jgi:hypothetical protein
MKRTMKRFLAIFLSFTMCIVAMPLTAFANEAPANE